MLLVESECKVGVEPLQAERNCRTDSVEGLCESILITPRSNLIGSRKVWVNQIIVLKGAKDHNRHPTVMQQDVGSTASAHPPAANTMTRTHVHFSFSRNVAPASVHIARASRQLTKPCPSSPCGGVIISVEIPRLAS